MRALGLPVLWTGGSANERAMQADAYNRIGDCTMTAVLNRLVRIMPVRWRLIRHWVGLLFSHKEAFVRGLQRDYNGKVQTLNRLISDYPNHNTWMMPFTSRDVLFVQMEDNANAIARFNILVKKFGAMSHGGQLTRSVCCTIRMTSILKPFRLISKVIAISGQ